MVDGRWHFAPGGAAELSRWREPPEVDLPTIPAPGGAVDREAGENASNFPQSDIAH